MSECRRCAGDEEKKRRTYNKKRKEVTRLTERERAEEREMFKKMNLYDPSISVSVQRSIAVQRTEHTTNARSWMATKRVVNTSEIEQQRQCM